MTKIEIFSFNHRKGYINHANSSREDQIDLNNYPHLTDDEKKDLDKLELPNFLLYVEKFIEGTDFRIRHIQRTVQPNKTEIVIVE